MPAAEGYQLKLPKAELDRLKVRIEDDHRSALSDHQKRIKRFVSYYQRWRNRYEPNPASDPDKPNFQVPLTKWQTYGAWAKEMDAIFGDDAEITAVPRGPSDEANVRKIGRYMTWRVFDSMRLVNPFTVFSFRKILFGRSHAYAPWIREDSIEGTEPDYEGPGFYPLWPDDFLCPAEEVTNLHEFSWVMRKYRETVDNLLRKQGKLYAPDVEKKHIDKLVRLADQGAERDETEGGDEVKLEKDEGEGVVYQQGLSTKDGIRIWEWHGRWRMLKGKATDADELSTSKREHLQTDLVVRFAPDLGEIVGVQKLRDLYPKMRRPRPFVETALTRDGSYWCPGYGEVMAELETELTAVNNLGVEGGQFTVGPMIFYTPAAGVEVQQMQYEPRMMIPVENTNAVKVVDLRADLSFVQAYSQTIISYAERLGQSDLSLGRQSDRPNAPRTVGQTVALIDEGNVRTVLDVRGMREDLQDILAHFWELDSDLAGEEIFFRVTEEEANGLFTTSKGGSTMTKAERNGKYDFRIQFATSTWNKEMKRQRQLELYGLDLQNPLIATNPRALWHLTNKVHEVQGDSNFARLISEPPDTELSINPKEELSRMLQGEQVDVRPMDNDMAHMTEHDQQIQRLKAAPNPDADAIKRMTIHYMAHIRQHQQKKLMQVLTQELAQGIGQLKQQMGGMFPGAEEGANGSQQGSDATHGAGGAPGGMAGGAAGPAARDGGTPGDYGP